MTTPKKAASGKLDQMRAGSRVLNPQTGTWVKRASTSGRFMEAKRTGGTFKGVRKEK